MEIVESLTSRLPPSRDDEPPALRQDIIDELADHLACSLQRELLRGGDPSAARARVLVRFGDPAAVARRLWLDAMKGKIMTQRVVIGASVVVALASLSMAGLFWQQTIRAQAMAREQADYARMREEEVLKQLRDMTTAIQHPRSLDWNPVKVLLTEGTADGPPATGMSISLLERNEQNQKQIMRQTNEAGVADFGLLHPGEYLCLITRNSPESKSSLSSIIDVRPGESVEKKIICPESRPQRVGVHLKCAWPADLDKEGLVLVTQIQYQYRETGPGVYWTLNSASSLESTQTLLLGPSNSISTVKLGGGGARDAADKARLGGGLVSFPVENLREPMPPGSTLELEVGNYRLGALAVWRRAPDDEPGRRRFERLVTTLRPTSPPVAENIGTAKQPAKHETAKPPATAGTVIELPWGYWQQLEASLVARPGKDNQWTIPLPEELVQAVREALKPDRAPRDAAAKADAVKSAD